MTDSILPSEKNVLDINKAIAAYKAAASSGDYESAFNHVQPICAHPHNDIASNAQYLAGICLLEMGNVSAAVRYLTDAIDRGNTNPALYELCWRIRFQSADYGESRRIILRGIENCGRLPTLLAQLAGLETRQGNYGEGRKLLDEALEREPGNSLAWINLGNLNETIGRVDAAVSCFRRALSVDSGNTIAISNLLFTLNYLPTPKKSLYQAHQLYTEPVESFAINQRPAKTRKKIRLAYLSSDFRFHAVAFFLFPLLDNHDLSRFEIFCYADNSLQDEVTESLKARATHWRDINALSDEKVARLLRADGIQILIDLSGHSLGRRLRLLKSKPVPIQISYLGYPNTLGMREVDYRIVDPITDPPGEEDTFFYEKLLRVSAPFIRYHPLGELPNITELPAAQRGFVTFGSFNRLSKITDEVVTAWSQILKAIPDARLLLKTQALEDDEVKAETVERFESEGVPADRITLRGWSKSHLDYLRSFSEVDVVLDTWPYNGTTTTCNALVMGVPVLAVRGDRHASRVSASILESLSLSRFTARDENQLVAIATMLAGDIPQLSRLRKSLRQTVLDSPLTDGKQLAAELETFYSSLV